MATIGPYAVGRLLTTEGHPRVYLGSRGDARCFIHEHSDPAVADHEFAMAARLRGTAIAPFTDKLEEGGKTYLVQEFEETVSAEEHARRFVGLEEKVVFAASILAALQEIHGKGVVLNSVTLAAIRVTPDGRVRFHHLSAARQEPGPPLEPAAPADPLYLSPERTGRVPGPVQRPSDYYAFGVVLYWLLTSQFPFESDDLSRLISLHVAKRPDAPASLDPAIPPNLSRIVEKLLEKSPSDRYQSAEGILFDLGHHAESDFELASRDVRLVFRTSDKIYGRQWEVGQLREAAREIADGDMQLATICGYSGVGKSAIVSEFLRLKEVDGSRLISGKFQQYRQDIPYFAITEAFEQLFDLLLLSPQTVLDEFRADFVREVGDQGLILTSIFPKLELIVDEQAPVEKLVGEAAENRFRYVFLKLVRIVAAREHPLILFLDDLQWTDLGSLNVLRALIRGECPFLLVVLSYRSNEVDQHHPFRHFLDDVAASDTRLREIQVHDLAPGDVDRLVTDSLGSENPTLSAIIHEKTRGNAFFVHQLLGGLADRGIFHWDAESGCWGIDADEVAKVEVSTNVVEFMQTRLSRFPLPVRDLVRVIGAVGHHADLGVLSVVTDRPVEEILATLELPLEDGLMELKQGEVYFSHDKIQEACYQLSDREELPRLHFAIANTLILHGRTTALDEIFSLAGHLDKGFECIGGNGEQYIGIYMAAALKSKEISAYREFLIYVRKAMALLQDATPERTRNTVCREYHIALYLNSLFDEADAFFDRELLHYPEILDLKENYFSKISQGSMQGRYREATEFAMSILGRMGIHLKIDPEMGELAAELDEVETLLAQAGIRTISDLQNIERRNIEEMEFVCEVILGAVPAAFFYNPTVACQLIFATLRLAVENGVFEAMGYPLSVASTPFILVRNDYRAGYAYAEYAIQIAAGNKRSLGNSKHLFILFCWHWSRPMKDDAALEIAREAHHLLMQGGDIQMAGYTFYNTITYLWERGERLETVMEEARKGLDFNVKTQNTHGIGLVMPHNQVVQALLSEDADFLRLGFDGFDEDRFVQENAQNAMGLCFFYIYKTQLAYICGAFEEAYAFSVRAREVLHFITGFPSTMSGIFYGALCRCERFAPEDEEWAGVLADLEQLRQWERGTSENFRHKLLLVEAEVARKEGDVGRAIDRYSQAVAAARKSRFTHETALIQERFSLFWYGLGNAELGDHFLKGAYDEYEAWGARRKLCLLRESHPDVLLDDKSGDLDLMSVVRAQNILAQETRIEDLLRQMMGILIELSGAEKAFLVLKGRTWAIEAFKGIQGEERILESMELSEDLLSVQMVDYVIRTGEPAQLERFSGLAEDPYIRRLHPQSVLVLPVAISGEFLAVIYLEHSKIHGMFTHSRQEAIKLLSAQIAISLRNAQVHNRLEDLVGERTAELAEQNEQLGLARRRADRASEAKSEFIANMSHELRTPLNAVTGYSELLSSMVSDPKQRSYLSSIKTAGRNLLTLINDILDLSKIEAGMMELHPSPVNLRQICEEVGQVLRLRATEKGLRFTIDLPEGLPDYLDLDETRIRQVLLNLVGNAIKFTERGAVSLRARTKRLPDRMVDLTISVEDSGIGIPEPDQERVFGTFDQQSNQDNVKYGGTGLGLSITRRLVEIMDGKVTLRSTPGEGSVFTVCLTTSESSLSQEHLLERDDDIDLDSISFTPATVLVVDDVDSNRELLSEMLDKMNLDVVTAGNGQEALLVAGELRPALILMDIRMPVMDGFEAVRRLKASPDTRDVPVVALTASSTRSERDYALEHGFDQFLSKPLRVQELVAMLSTYLERADGRRALAQGRPVPLALCREEIFGAELLVEKLSAEVLPLYRALGKALVVGDVRRLAKQLERLGAEHEAPPLVRYAHDLGEHVDMIDVRSIRRSLAAFPRLFGNLIDVEEPSHGE